MSKFSKAVLRITIEKDFGAKEIYQSMTQSKEVKAQMSKIFQQANRRIQNIKASGVVSPALKALQAEYGDTSAFSFFGKKNKSWAQLKYDYGRAVAFLQNPTSTAQGARQYVNDLASQTGLPFDISNNLMERVTSYTVDEGGNVLLDKYRELIDIVKNAVADVKEKEEALKIANQLDDELWNFAKETDKAIDREIKAFLGL